MFSEATVLDMFDEFLAITKSIMHNVAISITDRYGSVGNGQLCVCHIVIFGARYGAHADNTSQA
jgi:hypothetical protein